MYILLLDLLHRYIPASVNHTQAAPCGGAFMLQQVCCYARVVASNVCCYCICSHRVFKEDL